MDGGGPGLVRSCELCSSSYAVCLHQNSEQRIRCATPRLPISVFAAASNRWRQTIPKLYPAGTCVSRAVFVLCMHLRDRVNDWSLLCFGVGLSRLERVMPQQITLSAVFRFYRGAEWELPFYTAPPASVLVFSVIVLGL